MLTSIKSTIREFDMLKSGDKVIIALSGGADSVCLLHTMNNLKQELDIILEACHVNHNLRGIESDGDEAFVRKLCESANIPLNVRSVDVNALKEKHQSTEECARNVRYAFFDEIGNNAKIATAHTINDNAETVLLNLVRGTALKGLCGIPPVRGNIIRPLINISRKMIEEYCARNNIDFVTDKSNFSDDYTRNKLRINVIPLLEKINPSLCFGINRMCRALREDEAFFNAIAQKAEKAAVNENSEKPLAFKVSLLLKEETAVLYRIISSVLSQNNISPSTLRIKEIEKILRMGKGKVNIEKNKFAVVKNDEFYLENIHQNYRKYS